MGLPKVCFSFKDEARKFIEGIFNKFTMASRGMYSYLPRYYANTWSKFVMDSLGYAS